MSSIDDWDDSQPIYRQLREKIIALIIEGLIKEGEAIPSVRQVASDYRINHLTVSKAYQELVEEGLLQKRRGLGMFVEEGAQKILLERERSRFMDTEIKNLGKRMQQLGVSTEELVTLLKQINSEKGETT